MKTLAETQLENAKIKAKIAVGEYQKMEADTITAEQASAVSQSIDNIVNNAISKLSNIFATAIEQDDDETQIHYKLSDAAHSWLQDLSVSVGDVEDKTLTSAFKRSIKPNSLMTVSQCAEKYRVLKTGTNMPGPWRNKNAPHIVEIMDALSVSSPTKRVTFKKSSGVSGTEVWLNWLLYIAIYAKKDVLIVVPNLNLRNRTFNPKIKKLFQESPALKNLISLNTRDDKNSQDVLEVGDIRIIRSGANSPESFRAEHVPFAITDEKSAMPLDIGGEGDVGMLIDNRLKTYSRSKKFDLSSPTREGLCQISEDYEQGSQEQRYIYCPHCSHPHTLQLKNMKWTTDLQAKKKIVTNAWFECPACKVEISEKQKNDLLDNAVWIAKYPNRKKNHRSFTINAFYIKFGLGKTWKEIAQTWLDSQNDSSKLTTFVNTYLAETSKVESEGIDPNSLLARVEKFPNKMPPVIRIAGVDVQGNRLELTIVDFEKTKETWVQEHIIIAGEPIENEVWQELEHTLKAQKVDLAMIDSGYLTSKVHEFCAPRKWAIALKGISGMNRDFVESQIIRLKRLANRYSLLKPEPIGVDAGKVIVASKLNMHKQKLDIDKETGEILGEANPQNPNYIHFNNHPSLDHSYFMQLTAEVLETRFVRGKKTLVWTAIRTRNEALDCMVYAHAGFQIALQNNIPFQKINKNKQTGPTKTRKRLST